MEKHYTTLRVSELTETHISCLRAWIFEDFIKPLSVQESQSINIDWTREDVCAVTFLKYLIGKGYYRNNASVLAKVFLYYYSQSNLSTSKYFVVITTSETDNFYKCCNNHTAFVSASKKNSIVTDVSVFCLDVIFRDLFKKFKEG